jgi:hypothetical protein
LRRIFFVCGTLAVFAAGLSGCSTWANWTGKDEASADFEKAATADDARVREDKTRTNLSHLETAVADYVKNEGKVPEKLDALVPKYLPAIPSVEVAACGGDSNLVEKYPSNVLRDGKVDGARIHGAGRWGYVYDDARVVVFVDCLKPSMDGVPWYQVRGIY